MVVHNFSHNTNFCYDNINKNNNSDHSVVEEDFLTDETDHSLFDEFFNFPDDEYSTIFTDSNHSSSFTPIHTATLSGTHNFNPGIFDDATFSGNMCVPNDDLAGLEWLSNFDDVLFSNEDLHRMELESGVKASNDAESKKCELQPHPDNPTSLVFNSQVSIPAKARSRRARGPACNWSSCLHVLSPTISSPVSHLDNHVISPSKNPTPRRRNSDDNREEGRKCLHCATDKTPQWRTGPMGPKTLCNACGVRYKSGRLVPEYRPAASPTFTQTEHSNSHRKVMELRRQKEMSQPQHEQFIKQYKNMSMMCDMSSNPDDYHFIHEHFGPCFT